MRWQVVLYIGKNALDRQPTVEKSQGFSCLLLLAEAEEVLDSLDSVLVENGLIELVEHGGEALVLAQVSQVLVAADLHTPSVLQPAKEQQCNTP